MIAERKRLEKKIETIQKRLEDLPEGKLICIQNGEYIKWFHSDGHNKYYIPKKNRRLAEQLAEKKYLMLLQEDLTKEKQAINSYLKFHSADGGKAQQLLSKESKYYHLLASTFISKNQELQKWMESSYSSNKRNPENLIYKCSSGNIVRSKSEVIIDMFLYMNKVPFQYERELVLGNSVFYPDFTIRHPVTGKVYYWEHLGMMDDPSYIKNAYSKLQQYAIHGIIPSINLILTYETKDDPLSSEMVEKIIEYYFL